MKIAAIARNPENSPNMSDKDMQLFHKIAEELKACGHTVEILEEKDDISAKYDAVFHMSRTAATLEKLATCEAKGIYVTNPVKGVKNCSRREFIAILDANNIAQPRHTYINTTTENNKKLKFPGWLKKSKGWSRNACDVQFAASAAEYEKALARLAATGCDEAIYCEHISGDIVKFYGVRSEEFFRYHYPDPEKTKFGLEKINGTPQRHTFAPEKLRETAMRAAKAIGINIFGGDCIITADGEIYIIDINDFPSFAAYRDEAAKNIATSIIRKR